MSDQALAGLRVLDLSHHIAGPYCTKLLAGLGAEVIKVERPGIGGRSRQFGPFFGDVPHPEQSGAFLYLNTSKKSITLNLKSDSDRQTFLELTRGTDLVVENFAPRVMPSLALDFRILSSINPQLVLLSTPTSDRTAPTATTARRTSLCLQ